MVNTKNKIQKKGDLEMKKSFLVSVVLFTSVVFLFATSIMAYANEEDRSLKNATGILHEMPQKFHKKVEFPNGYTVVKLYNGNDIEEIYFQGYYPYISFEEGKEISISYQYSEKYGSRGFVILAVEYLE